MGLSDDKLKEIAQTLVVQIGISDDAKGTLPDRWAKNRSMYHAGYAEQAPEVIQGMGGYAIPLWKPKCDRIVNNTWSSLTDRFPQVQCLDITQQGRNNQRIEETLENLLDACDFDSILKMAIREGCQSNICSLRLRPKHSVDGPVVGFSLDMIHPEDIVAYPVYVRKMQDQKTCGFRYEEPRYRVEERQEAGMYRKCELVSGVSVQKGARYEDRMRGNPYITENKEDDVVELYELLTDLDLGEGLKTYLVQLSRLSSQILKIEPYAAVAGDAEYVEYREKWFTELRLRQESRFFWPQDSIANGVQDIQTLFSRIVTLIEQGSEMQAFGVTFMEGGSIGATAKRITPGMMIEVEKGVKFTTWAPSFNPGALFQILELLSNQVDALTGYGQLGTNQALPPSTSATEVNALMQALQETKDEYVDAVSPTVANIYSLAFQFLKVHYSDLKASFGDAITCSEEEVMEASIRFQVTGTSQASTSGLQLQKLMQVWQLAQANPMLINGSAVVKQILQALDLPFAVDTILYSKDQQAQMLALQSGMQPHMGEDAEGAQNGNSVPGAGANDGSEPGVQVPVEGIEGQGKQGGGGTSPIVGQG